jgi:hypothetical protein
MIPIGRLRVFCSKVYNLQLEHKLYFREGFFCFLLFFFFVCKQPSE